MVGTANAFIYGSCVTRDSVPLWREYGLDLAGYVARQSLISAHAPVDEADFFLEDIRPAFPKKMVLGDVQGNLFEKISSSEEDVDLLIWDLTDERNGIWEIPQGGYVTRLKTYRESYRGEQDLGRGILFGEQEHFTLWSQAVDSFISDLDKLGKLGCVVVNATPWASRFDTGEETAQAGRRGPSWFNAAAERYYEYLERAGVSVARPESERVVARRDHQWGAQPYHYTEDSYRAALEAILDKWPGVASHSRRD